MNKNIISIYPGHNANITFYSSAHNSYHIVEIEKLFGLKHARMETKHYVPFRDEYVNPLEAIPKALELAKKCWGIENDFHTVINGTACPDRNFFHQQVNPEVIEFDEQVIKVGLFELIDAFQKILDNIPGDQRVDFTPDRISVKDRISELVDILEQKGSITFEELFSSDTNKSEIIVTFLAVLEMVKLVLIRVVQHVQTGIIRIFYL